MVRRATERETGAMTKKKLTLKEAAAEKLAAEKLAAEKAHARKMDRLWSQRVYDKLDIP
jgi:hypothetical protein